MLKIYYTIWVDGLLKARSVNSNDWKFNVLILISMVMALDFAFFMAILQRNIIGINFYDITFHIFSIEKLNSILSFFVLYLSFPMCLNYLLIFRKNRYEKLFKIYKSYDGKYCMTYVMISLFLPLVIFLSAFLYNRYSNSW